MTHKQAMVGVSDSYVTCYTPEAKNVKLDIYSIHTALSRGSCRVSQDLGLLTVSFFFLFFFLQMHNNNKKHWGFLLLLQLKIYVK